MKQTRMAVIGIAMSYQHDLLGVGASNVCSIGVTALWVYYIREYQHSKK